MAGLLTQLTMGRAVALAFLFAALFRFFIYDDGSLKQTAIKTAEASLVQMQAELKAVDGKLDRAHEYQRSAAEMGEALNKLLAYIPEDYRLQDFMKVVSEEAKVAGLNIIRIVDVNSPSKTPRKEFEELAVSVDLEGSFAQQLTFLSNLTKEKQIFTIDQFKMDKERTRVEVDQPSVSFKGNIRAYRYIGEKAKI
jgi:Tfp pilus assembly protein PilO